MNIPHAPRGRNGLLATLVLALNFLLPAVHAAVSPAPLRPADGVPRIYAIFIGHTGYFGWKDARDMYLFLRDTQGARAEDMFVLLTNTAAPDTNPEIVDGVATVANLEAAFGYCAANMDADDLFFWQIEAHGNGYIGRDANDPDNIAYHGYFGSQPRIAQASDERDFLERDLEFSVLCGNGLLDGKDYHYGMGQWGVSWYFNFQILKRMKVLSRFTDIYVEGRGLVSDNDVRLERFTDYALGDANKNGAIDPGEVADFDGDGIPPYNRETGEFDDDDWGPIDFYEDNLAFGHSSLVGVNFTLFDANFDNHLDVDINPGAILEVDGTDLDNDGCIDGFDLNDDGNRDSWVSIDETLSLANAALTDDQIRVYLDALTNGIKVVVTSTCHGGGFINDLSSPTTVVLAGGPEHGRTPAAFVHQCFRASFTTHKTQADVDGNGLVSFAEAINFAKLHPWTSTAPHYDAFVYDDNGDYVGHPMPLPNGGDGTLGANLFWELGLVVDVQTLTAAPSLISPNGDGFFDSATISATSNLPLTWTVNVRNSSDSLVKTLAGFGASLTLTWDGKDEAGVVVPDGSYTIEAIGAAPNRVSDRAITTVTVDTAPVDVLPLTIDPNLITPNGDDMSESTVISTSLSSPASWTLVIRDGLGSIVKQTSGTDGAISYVWNGSGATGNFVPNGVYIVEISASAPNGTSDRESGSITVDKTRVEIGAVTVSPTSFSPNGDGIAETTSISAAINTAVPWVATITDAGGTIAKTVNGFGLAASLTWDGTDDFGTALPSGTYTVKITATAENGSTDDSTAPVTLDRTVVDVHSLVITPDFFSPNSDGIADSTTITAEINVATPWTLRIRDASNVLVRTVTGSSSNISFNWNGRNDLGSTVPNGTYTIEATATATNGSTDGVSGSVSLNADTVRVQSMGAGPSPFSPNGDGFADTLTVTADISTSATWTLTIRDQGGAIVKTVNGSGSNVSYIWNGTDNAGAPAPSGTYVVQARATLSNGSTDSMSLSVGLDRTIVVVQPLVLAPQFFSPNADGIADTTSITTQINVAAPWTLIIRSGGTTVRTVNGSGMNVSFTWGGTDDSGAALPNGNYLVQVRATASNGSTHSVADTVTLDRTLMDVQALVASPAAISPNGDGTQDSTSLTATFNVTASWTLTIRNSSGATVKTATGSGASMACTWDGADTTGASVPDGVYTATIVATAANGTTDQSSGSISVDALRPTISNLRDSRDPFRPSRGETTVISFTLSEGGTLNALIYNSSNTLVRTLFSGASATLNHALTWNGRNNSNALLPSGTYTYRVTVADAAGNTSSTYQGTSQIK